jgi:hypothetical protein
MSWIWNSSIILNSVIGLYVLLLLEEYILTIEWAILGFPVVLFREMFKPVIYWMLYILEYVVF